MNSLLLRDFLVLPIRTKKRIKQIQKELIETYKIKEILKGVLNE